jgi:hypothetical protein
MAKSVRYRVDVMQRHRADLTHVIDRITPFIGARNPKAMREYAHSARRFALLISDEAREIIAVCDSQIARDSRSRKVAA